MFYRFRVTGQFSEITDLKTGRDLPIDSIPMGAIVQVYDVWSNCPDAGCCEFFPRFIWRGQNLEGAIWCSFLEPLDGVRAEELRHGPPPVDLH